MMNSTSRLRAVDGLRAMAMLMVFSFHSWEFAGRPRLVCHLGSWSFDALRLLGMGGLGVDVFVVLSGFCLFLPLCSQPERLQRFNPKTYAVRRVCRIIPAYYAAIAYALALRAGGVLWMHLHARGKPAGGVNLTAFDVLTHLTFTHTLFAHSYFAITGAFWSLGLEAQFYLVFPLVVWAFNRFGARVIGALFGVSLAYHVAANWLGVGEVREVYNFFFGRWMQFAVGMAVALLSRRRLNTPIWVGAGLVLLAVFLFFVPKPALPFLSAMAMRQLLLGVSAGALLFALCTSGAPIHFLWSNRVSASLGLISYSFFLIHQPTMLYLAQVLKRLAPALSGPWHFLLLVSVGFWLCLAISIGFFRLFEKPFLSPQRVS